MSGPPSFATTVCGQRLSDPDGQPLLPDITRVERLARRAPW